jgi:hypothetical protein
VQVSLCLETVLNYPELAKRVPQLAYILGSIYEPDHPLGKNGKLEVALNEVYTSVQTPEEEVTLKQLFMNKQYYAH